MPTYDYKCESCGHAFEKFQSMTARPVRKCPECKANAVKRLIGTGAGVIFKGSGFYQTDYRPKSYAEAAKKGQGDGGAGGEEGRDEVREEGGSQGGDEEEGVRPQSLAFPRCIPDL